ncbi:hypothetical protein CLW00_10427 [Mongoliibacter ruber]|uniref:Uncharacterized protein n=1 Tax=Mongoliibacter ruber TaxID=1750599 RepID=A0A2T0WNV2_9BACT|nr:hypothetical protein CLW00_10427 [Mongoliibacter ruber]
MSEDTHGGKFRQFPSSPIHQSTKLHKKDSPHTTTNPTFNSPTFAGASFNNLQPVPQFVNSSVHQFISSSVPLFISSPIRQFPSSSIHQFVNSPIHQFPSSPIPQFINSPVHQFISSSVRQTVQRRQPPHYHKPNN